MRDELFRYIILGCQYFFSLRQLKNAILISYSFHYFDVDLAINHIIFLYVTCHLSLAALKIVSLSLTFNTLTMMAYPSQGLLNFLEL